MQNFEKYITSDSVRKFVGYRGNADTDGTDSWRPVYTLGGLHTQGIIEAPRTVNIGNGFYIQRDTFDHVDVDAAIAHVKTLWLAVQSDSSTQEVVNTDE